MRELILGIQRKTKRFVLAIFFGYVTLWTFLEPLFAVLNFKIESYNWIYLVGYLIISLTIAVIVVYPKKKIELELKNTNTKVIIEFGDLFKFLGNKVISVNNYFDTEIGLPVSEHSIHGYFIQNIIGNHTNIIEKAVKEQLQSIPATNIPKSAGNKTQFPIGTTIHIDFNKTKYFLFALGESDKKCKATSNPANMLVSLNGLWHGIRDNGNGAIVNIPLIGSGLSGVGIHPSQLIQLILISLLKFVKTYELSTTVRIVLRNDLYDKIDLELIKNNWQ